MLCVFVTHQHPMNIFCSHHCGRKMHMIFYRDVRAYIDPCPHRCRRPSKTSPDIWYHRSWWRFASTLRPCPSLRFFRMALDALSKSNATVVSSRGCASTTVHGKTPLSFVLAELADLSDRLVSRLFDRSSTPQTVPLASVVIPSAL